MRRFLEALLRLTLRIFFRRIEIEGADRVPRSGPVVIAVNHPNALIDPLFLLCFAPRPVSFLAKAPLFHMPVIGFFVRAFDAIPVHRRQDSGSDLARNRETFARAFTVLARGGSVAIFPEGASHDEPKLLPLKTGAARIALGAAAETTAAVTVVPAGLYYTWKRTFRSAVLLSYGAPIPVARSPLAANGEPPPDAVRTLTAEIESGLAGLTLQSETHEAGDLIRKAERVFTVSRSDGVEASLFDELEVKRRFVVGYQRLRERDPGKLEALRSRLARFEEERRQAGIRTEDLTPEALDLRRTAQLIARGIGDLALAPFAIVGLVVHYPAYRLIGWIARLVARREEDVVATAKILAAMLFFPVTWILIAFAVFRRNGPWAGTTVLALLPLCGYAALRLMERLDEIAGRARAWLHLTSSGYALRRLIAERLAIREEILSVADELGIGE